MQLFSQINEWQQARANVTNHRLGFVPTMGHLHAGHRQLINQAKQQCQQVVVSIYVNPTQFNQASDYRHYPKTLADDLQQLTEAGVDYVFAPDGWTLYPDQYQFRICAYQDDLPMEGQYRPGHFAGMLTVILKLFQLIQPTHAFFGEKDYQQWQLVQQMCQAFFMPIEVICCPTVREQSGLALSSRNSHLSATARQHAGQFYHCLIQRDKTDQQLRDQLSELGFTVDYVHTEQQRRFAAVVYQGVRLIDNVVLA